MNNLNQSDKKEKYVQPNGLVKIDLFLTKEQVNALFDALESYEPDTTISNVYLKRAAEQVLKKLVPVYNEVYYGAEDDGTNCPWCKNATLTKSLYTNEIGCTYDGCFYKREDSDHEGEGCRRALEV